MAIFLEVLSILRDISVILNILFAIVVVFFERKNPAVTWAWLMVILIVPYIGFIIYAVIGQDSRKYHVFQQKTKEDEILHKEYDKNFTFHTHSTMQKKDITRKNIFDITGHKHFNDMVYLNLSAGLGNFVKGNGIKLFHEGTSKFESLIADIKEAKHYVHLQYYILQNDNLAREILHCLTQKAASGVEVKLAIDGMGCHKTSGNLFAPLIKAGGQVAIFLPPNLIRVNYRNHRKIAVIDGHIGYVGGLNIGDEYVSKSKKFGFWRDCHVKIVGEATKELELRFLMDWNFCANKKINKHNLKIRYAPGILKKVVLDTLKIEKKYFPSEFPAKTNIDYDNVNVQIVSSGPDTKWRSLHDSYLKMISEADKSIYIQSPYFVPSDSIFEALRIAALSGIDVKIMIPAIPDHPFVYWAALSYLGELLNAGVKCYKYEKGFVHSKTVVVDGLISSVGTANMDVRSFSLNFEVNAFIYDERVAKELEKEFINDLVDCTEILQSWYLKRSVKTKIKESISRLLSPLL